MSKVEEIETAILTLDPAQQSKLFQWLDAHLEDVWDAQMKADAKAGKFDRFRQEISLAEVSGKLIDFP